MADLLAPSIWWLHGTRGSNVYLVEADDGRLALVDTGFASSAGAILQEVRAHGGDLSAVLLTHMHGDHSGAAGEICRKTGARLHLGRGDCFEQGGRLHLRARVGRSHIRRLIAARVRNEQPRPVPVDVALDGEIEVLPGIRAVPAPGHTRGSYCYLVPRASAAFVGDLVIIHGGTLTRSMQMANQEDDQYLESLRAFGEVAPGAGFPGHGKPLLVGFGEAMRELAAMPRRPASPGNILSRTMRLWSFSRGMWRTRRR